MIFHGITPGPLILERQPELVWGLIVSMWIGNVMLLIINRGSLSAFYGDPVPAILLGLAAVFLVAAIVPSIRRWREEVFEEED